jgi:hypothetical protein
MKYALVLVLWTVLDMLLARYVKCLQRNQYVQAATTKVLVATIVVIGQRLYVNDLWCLIPVCIGTFLGVLLANRVDRGQAATS